MRLRTLIQVAFWSIQSAMRDRLAAVFIVFLPILLILLLGTASARGEYPVGVSVGTPDGLSEDVVQNLDEEASIRVVRYPSEAMLREAVQHRQVVSGVVIPVGYQDSLRRGVAVKIGYLTDASMLVPPEVSLVVTGEIDRQSILVAAARSVARTSGKSFNSAVVEAQHSVRSTPAAAEIIADGDAAPPPSGFGYSARAMLVLFMFANVLGASRDLVYARQNGALRRASSTPTPLWVLLFGYGLGQAGIALLQAGSIVTAGSLIFDVRWGPLPAVVLLICVYSVVCAAGSLLLASIVRTPDAAMAAAAPIGILLGMLGGCIWPLAAVSPVLAEAGHLFPQAWAMDAQLTLSSGSSISGEFFRQIGVLSCFAATLCVVAGSLLRSRLATI